MNIELIIKAIDELDDENVSQNIKGVLKEIFTIAKDIYDTYESNSLSIPETFRFKILGQSFSYVDKLSKLGIEAITNVEYERSSTQEILMEMFPDSKRIKPQQYCTTIIFPSSLLLDDPKDICAALKSDKATELTEKRHVIEQNCNHCI